MLQKFSLKSLFFFTLKSLYKGTEKNTWELYGTKWRNRVQNCLSHHSHLVSFLDACDLSSLYSPFGYKITVLKISNLKSQLFRGRENFLKKQKKKKKKICGNLDISFPLFHQKSIMLQCIIKDYLPYHST